MILGVALLTSMSCGLFWLYIAMYLAVDLILILLSFSSITGLLEVGFIIQLVGPTISYRHDKLTDLLFIISLQLPVNCEAKRLVYKHLCNLSHDSNPLILDCWVCFPVKVDTLQTVI